jgi:hypothetical protein
MYNRAKTRDLLDPKGPRPDESALQYPTREYQPSERLKVQRSRVPVDAASVPVAGSSSSDSPVSSIPNVGGPSGGTSINKIVIPLPARGKKLQTEEVQNVGPPAPIRSTRLPSRRMRRAITPPRFYAAVGTELPPPVETPPLQSPFAVRQEGPKNQDVAWDGRVRFKSPIVEETPLHIRIKRTKPMGSMGLSARKAHEPPFVLSTGSSSASNPLTTSALSALPSHIPASYSRLPTRVPMDDKKPSHSTTDLSPPTSPMPAFPPTPPSPCGSPKWPSSKARSPSTDSEDDEEREVGKEEMGLMEEAATVDGSENEMVVDAPPHAPEAKGNTQIISRRDEREDSMDTDEKAKEVLDGWKAKYEALLSEVQNVQVGRQASGPSRQQRRKTKLLSQVLQAQMLIGTSIDIMKDCLLKFEADGHSID